MQGMYALPYSLLQAQSPTYSGLASGFSTVFKDCLILGDQHEIKKHQMLVSKIRPTFFEFFSPSTAASRRFCLRYRYGFD
jgi:hypothetical protein